MSAAGGTVVDLNEVDSREREAAWREAAPMLLPNLAVHFEGHHPPAGNLAYVPLGSGGVWTIRSSPAKVEYHAPRSRSEAPDRVALCMQAEGSSLIYHKHNQMMMSKGDIGIIDEKLDFDVVSADFSTLAIVQLPRSLVLTKIPFFDHFSGTKLSRSQPGPAILGDLIMSILKHCRGMAEPRHDPLLLAIVNSFTSSLEYDDRKSFGIQFGRVAAALSFMEANIHSADFCPTSVATAQRISRRRLDQIMIETTGESVAGYIWKRRLENASSDLRDPEKSRQSITSIAFDNGFKDSGHFSRAFKKLFGTTPSTWRQAGMEGGQQRNLRSGSDRKMPAFALRLP